MEEEGIYLGLHHSCERRAVACTWEPGASAPSFTPILSSVIEVLLLLGVCIGLILILDMFCKDLKIENVFFSVKTYQCIISCIFIDTGPPLPESRGIFSQ